MSTGSGACPTPRSGWETLTRKRFDEIDRKRAVVFVNPLALRFFDRLLGAPKGVG
jgi:hypothetical protein